MPPGPWALAATTASSWRPTWTGWPWATSTKRSPLPGPQRRRDRRRPPPPRRSAAGPGEVLDGAAPPPPGRRHGRRRGPGTGRAGPGRPLSPAVHRGWPPPGRQATIMPPGPLGWPPPAAAPPSAVPTQSSHHVPSPETTAAPSMPFRTAFLGRVELMGDRRAVVSCILGHSKPWLCWWTATQYPLGLWQ